MWMQKHTNKDAQREAAVWFPAIMLQDNGETILLILLIPCESTSDHLRLAFRPFRGAEL